MCNIIITLTLRSSLWQTVRFFLLSFTVRSIVRPARAQTALPSTPSVALLCRTRALSTVRFVKYDAFFYREEASDVDLFGP
jgi:hypothetical protein